MRKQYVLTIIVLILLLSKCFSQSNWNLLYGSTVVDLRSVYFINELTGWASGNYSTIRKTTNGGVNWINQSIENAQGLESIYFINSQTGWICGGHQYLSAFIAKTTNGGDNWTQVYGANNGMVYKQYFINSNTGWASCDFGNLLKSTNGGTTWIVKPSGVSQNLTGCCFVDAQTGWVIGDSGTILKSTDAGSNWVRQSSGTTYNLEGLFFQSSSTGYLVGYNGVILKTTNGGANWVSKPSGSTFWLNSVCFVNGLTGWAVGGVFGGSVSQILRTCNAGENWSVISSPANSWLAEVRFVNVNTGWAVGSNGVILKTTNGGAYIPQPPALIYPPDSSTVSTLTPSLTWNTAPCAIKYKVQISTVSSFASIVDSATITAVQYTVPSGKLANLVKYYWRVSSVSSDGAGQWSTAWNFTPQVIGIIKISSEVPETFSLCQNYPNPFNPETRIKFAVPRSSFVRILIYDAVGREITGLVNEQLQPGSYETDWNASGYPSGIYFYKLITDSFTDTKKMVLIK